MTDFSDFADLERAGWGAADLSGAYVDLFSPASDMAIPALIRALPGSGAVLDLCCGQGNITAALLAAGYDVTGLDFSPAMLAHARARAPGAMLIEGDAQSLPFEDETFDCVVSGFGLVHVPDQPRALAEIARVLRPEGILALSAWAGPPASPAFATVFGAIGTHGDKTVSLPPGPDFHQFADPEKAAALLSDAGLRHERSETVPCEWRLKAPEDLFEIFAHGAPRAGHLLRNQCNETRTAIRDAITATVRTRFAGEGGWIVPVPAAVVVASRP